MTHFFDTKYAEKYGVNPAIILQNIIFWLEKNRADGRNIEDDRVWTQMSHEGMKAYFPYLTVNQIRHAINKLTEDGVIMAKQLGYDRTKFYSLTDEFMRENSLFHLGNFPDGSGKNPSCYKYIYTDNKKDNSEVDLFELHKDFENIYLTNKEYRKLVARYGEEATFQALVILSEWKINKPEYAVKIKSDYLAMLKWVFKAVFRKNPELENIDNSKDMTLEQYSEFLINERGLRRDSIEYEQMMTDHRLRLNRSKQ